MTEKQGQSGEANGAEVMRKFRVRSRMDGERREGREALSVLSLLYSLSGRCFCGSGGTKKKAHQMETITLTGGDNTVPHCAGVNAVVVIRGKTSDCAAARVQIHQ